MCGSRSGMTSQFWACRNALSQLHTTRVNHGGHGAACSPLLLSTLCIYSPLPLVIIQSITALSILLHQNYNKHNSTRIFIHNLIPRPHFVCNMTSTSGHGGLGQTLRKGASMIHVSLPLLRTSHVDFCMRPCSAYEKMVKFM